MDTALLTMQHTCATLWLNVLEGTRGCKDRAVRDEKGSVMCIRGVEGEHYSSATSACDQSPSSLKRYCNSRSKGEFSIIALLSRRVCPKQRCYRSSSIIGHMFKSHVLNQVM